jgi:hypothetical protein
LQNHKKVISLPVVQWRFFDYSEDVEFWYQNLSEVGKDTFDSTLKINSKADAPSSWTGCKWLQGPYKKQGIWEWRFTVDGVQERLLGVFGPGRKTAIFLIGCNHKMNVYKPANCLDTALARAKTIKTGMVFHERKIKSNL